MNPCLDLLFTEPATNKSIDFWLVLLVNSTSPCPIHPEGQGHLLCAVEVFRDRNPTNDYNILEQPITSYNSL